MKPIIFYWAGILNPLLQYMYMNVLFSCYKLQMNTSGGGGFCDCGDAEAWKDGVACDTHQHTDDTDMEEVQYFDNLRTTICITQQAKYMYRHQC